MNRYLAFDIGCLHCDEPSGVIGTYATRELAMVAAAAAEERQAADWHGEHDMRVYDLETREDVTE